VLPQLLKERSSSEKRAFSSQEVLVRANALFHAEESKDLRGLIQKKIEDLRDYDVPAMQRVVAILSWGRSGSLLLASYLDGHDDVILLPELCGQRLDEFFELHRGLSLSEKLLAYPAFEPGYPRFFEGDFPISAEQYYAAVQAIHEVYAEWPPEFLESRRAFFLFVHIAYNLALGRKPASPHPLIVYAQHGWDNVLATHLVEDFPEAKFVHTVRDPLSSSNGMFHYLFGVLGEHFPRTYVLAPYSAVCCLANTDQAHLGMESRTRTIRFEDLHSDLADTMGDLAEWLGLPFQPTLLNSTFNEIPWVVKRDGKAWSGRRLDQVQRQSWDLSARDRALLFSVFYENFVQWHYPCPKIFGNSLVRSVVYLSLFLIPMKTEVIAARAVFKHRILPSLRHGELSRALKSMLGIGLCRLKIIRLLTPLVFRRCLSGAALLKVDQKSRPMDRGQEGARAARSET
jgi:hypothetical protein